MSICILENENVIISAKDDGAELCSIKSKKNNIEYLWQGDSKYWNRHAPVLFPIVGRLKDSQYIVDGTKYNMSQHGFARDKKFTIIEVNKNRVEYGLNSDENTEQIYPYKFEMKICYDILEYGVKTNYIIKNKSNKDMYFSIGAHPGFNCPLKDKENFNDYYIEFEKVESSKIYSLNNGLIGNRDRNLELLDNKTYISKELFKDDALIYENLNSSWIALKSNKNNYGIKVKFNDFPYLGVWSKPEGAPFVCIEPWYGIADTFDSDNILKNKKGILKLKPEEVFECNFDIEIF